METKQKKPIFKKWWFWVIIVFVLLIIIGALGGKSDKTPDTPFSSKATASDADVVSGNTDDSASVAVTEGKKESYAIGEGQVRVWQDGIGSNWISVAVPIKNDGTETLYLSTGSIDIEDASGALVKTISMVNVYPQVLLPGETAYYYEETTMEENISGDGLAAVPHVDIKKAKVDCVRYETSEVTVKDTEYYGAKVVGRVENTSDQAESSIYIIANIFDASGNLLAQQLDILSNEVQPGEKIGFETSNLGFNFSASEVASYEIFAFPYQYQF